MEDDPGFERERLEEFVEEYLELDRGVQRPRDIYSILGGPREAKYQRTLRYLLDPGRPHGFDAALLEVFLDCVGFQDHDIAGQHVEIETEVQVTDDVSDGRIDLVISGGSALADHPTWAVFLELKVGADEGRGQTTTYAETDEWSFSWFDSDRLDVDRLDSKKYVYVRRDAAEPPDDETDTFDTVSWREVVEALEAETESSFFEYPNRSVVQLTDFIRSLKETENMTSSIDEREIERRLKLYYEHSDLIQKVEEANSRFENDFDDLGSHLQDSWVERVRDRYDVEGSGWRLRTPSNPKWQGLRPEHWSQGPFDGDSTIELYFHHVPTSDVLRDGELSFRLRIPPHRNAHTEELHEGRSFNDAFTQLATTEYREEIHDALRHVDDVDTRFDSSATLVSKSYPLDTESPVDSYHRQLTTAISELCTRGLPEVVNQVFEASYLEVFWEEPEGEFGGELVEREC